MAAPERQLEQFGDASPFASYKISSHKPLTYVTRDQQTSPLWCHVLFTVSLSAYKPLGCV